VRLPWSLVRLITSDGTYPTFNFHVAAGGGGRLVRVPYRDDRQDLSALLDAAVREGARILYVCNPDNPMGSFWPGADLKALIAALPDGLLLCLDEAYCDTAPADELLPIDAATRRCASHLLQGLRPAGAHRHAWQAARRF
jgi:histidinol-phosphate aminotransferase